MGRGRKKDRRRRVRGVKRRGGKEEGRRKRLE